MEIKSKESQPKGTKFFIEKDGLEIGRGFLYIFKNDLHQESSLVGYIEDVFVKEEFRGTGYGKEIINKIIQEAKKQGCYKLIGNSRYGRERLHAYYEELGFKDHGKSFRMNF